MILVFLCSGPVCKSCLWTHVVSVVVATLCFCGISMFVFTVTTENEGGLLSPSYRWKYMVSPRKLMTEPGNEHMILSWMSIPPPGELSGCGAEPCLFLAQEVRAHWHAIPSFGILGVLLGTSLVRLFCVRSGRIPQLLWVLMFALLRPLPQCTALTL